MEVYNRFDIRKTYRASGNLAPAVTADAPFLAIQGAANKVIRITKIKINGPTLTALAYQRIAVRKYSAAPTGGTPVAATKVPLDTLGSNAPSAATVNTYTAAPTPGALVGQISERTVLAQATVPAAGAPLDEGDFDWTAAEQNTEFPTLRALAETVAVVFPVAPATPVTFSWMIEWTEDGK